MTKYEAAFTALLVCIACWGALKWAGRVAANRDDDLCFWLAACCYSPETSKSIEASEIFAVFGVKSNHSVNIWAMCYIFIFHLCFTSAVFIVSWVFFFMLVDHYSKFIIICDYMLHVHSPLLHQDAPYFSPSIANWTFYCL